VHLKLTSLNRWLSVCKHWPSVTLTLPWCGAGRRLPARVMGISRLRDCIILNANL